MSTLGLVEVVRHLPPATGILANTALQLRCWSSFEDGCHLVHAFVLDDPLAATLEPGQWVTFRKSARSTKLSSLERAYPDEGLRYITEDREATRKIAAIAKLLEQRGVAAKDRGDRHGQAYEVYRKMSLLTAGFGVYSYPTELLMSCFPLKVARLLQAA